MKRLLLISLAIFLLSINSISLASLAFPTSSAFGWRIHPITGKQEFHNGIDIPAQYGTPILAVLSGTIVWAAPYGGYGNAILVKHSKNSYILYGHCARISVKTGQKVKTGEVIGSVGSTGSSTGPHLHLAYWVNGKYIDPMVLWKSSSPTRP